MCNRSLIIHFDIWAGEKILPVFQLVCNETILICVYTSETLCCKILITGGDRLEDNAIIDLYFKRSEQAIVETDAKYGGYCYSIAYNILSNREDSEESVSDTYLAVWNAIPPRRPNFFNAFLAKLTRYISIDRWRKSSAKKRAAVRSFLPWRNWKTAWTYIIQKTHLNEKN